MTTQPPRSDAEEPAIVTRLRIAFDLLVRGKKSDLVAYEVPRWEFEELLDALKARADEPSERERELIDRVEALAVRCWDHDAAKLRAKVEDYGAWALNTARQRCGWSGDSVFDAFEAIDVLLEQAQETKEERDRLQSELAEARAAVAKAVALLRAMQEHADDNDRDDIHVTTDTVRSYAKRILESLQPAAEKAEEKPTGPPFHVWMYVPGTQGGLSPCTGCGAPHDVMRRYERCIGKKPTEEKTMAAPAEAPQGTRKVGTFTAESESGNSTEGRLTREEIGCIRDVCTKANVFVELHPDEVDDMELAPDELVDLFQALPPRTVAKLLSAAERDISRAEQEREGGEQEKRLARVEHFVSVALAEPKRPLESLDAIADGMTELVAYLREERRAR